MQRVFKISAITSFVLSLIGFVMCLGGSGVLNDMRAGEEDLALIQSHERLLQAWETAEIIFLAVFVISLVGHVVVRLRGAS